MRDVYLDNVVLHRSKVFVRSLLRIDVTTTPDRTGQRCIERLALRAEIGKAARRWTRRCPALPTV